MPLATTEDSIERRVLRVKKIVKMMNEWWCRKINDVIIILVYIFKKEKVASTFPIINIGSIDSKVDKNN
jgi:hypothetical protein